MNALPNDNIRFAMSWLVSELKDSEDETEISNETIEKLFHGLQTNQNLIIDIFKLFGERNLSESTVKSIFYKYGLGSLSDKGAHVMKGILARIVLAVTRPTSGSTPDIVIDEDE